MAFACPTCKIYESSCKITCGAVRFSVIQQAPNSALAGRAACPLLTGPIRDRYFPSITQLPPSSSPRNRNNCIKSTFSNPNFSDFESLRPKTALLITGIPVIASQCQHHLSKGKPESRCDLPHEGKMETCRVLGLTFDLPPLQLLQPPATGTASSSL